MKKALEVTSTDIQLTQVTGNKPEYEVGAQAQLKISFAKKTGEFFAFIYIMYAQLHIDSFYLYNRKTRSFLSILEVF